MNTRHPDVHQKSALLVFVSVATGVFLVVLMTATYITFLLPVSYMSTARIMVAEPQPAIAGERQEHPAEAATPLAQTECEVIVSERVLLVVVERLALDDAWGRKFNNGERLRPSLCIDVLRSCLHVAPVGSTRVISIAASSDKPEEAAAIANSVVSAYVDYASDRPNPVVVQVLDVARPSLRPSKPNKTMNLVLGVLVGGLLGLGAGGIGAVLVLTGNRRRRGSPPAPPPLPQTASLEPAPPPPIDKH